MNVWEACQYEEYEIMRMWWFVSLYGMIANQILGVWKACNYEDVSPWKFIGIPLREYNSKIVWGHDKYHSIRDSRGLKIWEWERY